MEELKVTAIVVSNSDYKENDKLVTLFSLELGILKANIKGVKQAKSKLKFACQPFFVGEFFLVKTGTTYLVKTVNAIDNFYDLTTNYDRYLVATIMMEACKLTLKEGMINEQLFLNLLKHLELICYDTSTNELIILTKFMLNILKLSGFELNFDNCAVCGIKLTLNSNLSLSSNGIVCEACSDEYALKIEKNVYSSLKIINNSSLDRLSTIKLKKGVLIHDLMLLKINFNNVFKTKLNSINNLLI